jgi:hypothetical protein
VYGVNICTGLKSEFANMVDKAKKYEIYKHVRMSDGGFAVTAKKKESVLLDSWKDSDGKISKSDKISQDVERDLLENKAKIEFGVEKLSGKTVLKCSGFRCIHNNGLFLGFTIVDENNNEKAVTFSRHVARISPARYMLLKARTAAILDGCVLGEDGNMVKRAVLTGPGYSIVYGWS